jgi:hypothetical protein
MDPVNLESVDGTPLTVDHCCACRLVWFDTLESVRLSALGWVRLLRAMQRDLQALPGQPLEDRVACPVCSAALRGAHNQTRFGRFVTRACPQGHGDLQSDVGLLAQRGLVRPLGASERRALAAERHTIRCLSCGAAPAPGDDVCSYCHSPLLVLDLPRLAHSLLPRPQSEQASPRALGNLGNWACRGCGVTIDAARDTACTHCGHLVVALDMPDLAPVLDAAEQRLAEHAQARAVVADAVRRGHAQTVGERDVTESRSWITARPGALGEPRWMLGGWLPLWLALGAALLVAALG